MANAGKREYAKAAPTMLEFLSLCAIRQSGGEFVDVATIQNLLRRRAQIEYSDAAYYTMLNRMCKTGLLFETKQDRHRGESSLFFTLTDEGNRFITEWLGKLTSVL
jgi:hypothetical protein